ncbi:MAG: MSMEG_1061 family FMN-dependent PPOX-type flavoprotein [Actinomycetota bacterium]
MTTTTSFANTLTSVDQLDGLYRPASQGVKDKETQLLDQGCRDFIAMSTFVLVGTSDPDGDLDVSPRGGPAGFVKVLDEHRLAIPDLNGNNRLDSIRNIIRHGRVGLIFLIPGLGETLRINGEACITTDDAVLDRFTEEFRRPKSAIGVTIDHGFIHCAKSIRRGGLWQPDTWAGAEERPSAGQILVDHAGVGEFITGAQLDEDLEKTYVNDLAADLPDGPSASGD